MGKLFASRGQLKPFDANGLSGPSWEAKTPEFLVNDGINPTRADVMEFNGHGRRCGNCNHRQVFPVAQ
jgi:hypothetical protein